jgi:hypothetical protein
VVVYCPLMRAACRERKWNASVTIGKDAGTTVGRAVWPLGRV